MKNTYKAFAKIVGEYHNEVVLNIITFKNVFDLRAIPAIILGYFLALNFSQMLLTAFLLFYVMDYATGILATIIELKKEPEKLAERRERKPKGYWIESDRIIRGIVKMLIYLQILMFTYVFTFILKSKEIAIHSSIIDLNLIQIVLILCIASEFVSNLENAKRAGFDVVGIIGIGIKKVWNIKNLINTGKDGTTE